MLFRRRQAKETPPSWRYAIPLALAIFVFVAFSLFQNGRWLKAQNDFAVFYMAGELQPLGQLYDVQAYYQRQPALLGGHSPTLIYIRPPFYSLLFVPLAKMPFQAAYLVYQVLQIGLLALWLRMAWPSHPKLVLTAGLSLPLLLALGNGQDAVGVTALCGIAWQWLERRPFAAGVLLALCSLKIHLFVLVPFALARFGRWRTIAGGACGGLALVGLSFVAGGRNWITEYLRVLDVKDIHSKIYQAGNIRALVDALRWPPEWAAWLMAVGLVACLCLALRKSRTVAEALVYSVAGAMVFNWHSFLQDFTILLALAPWVATMELDVWADRVWRFVLSPVPYLAAMLGAPLSAVLPISVMAFLALSHRAVRSREAALSEFPAPADQTI